MPHTNGSATYQSATYRTGQRTMRSAPYEQGGPAGGERGSARRGASEGALRGALEGALKGAVASLVGGLVLRAVWEAGQRMLPADEKLPSPTGETVKKLAEKRGLTLSDAQQQAATVGVYSAAMLGWGAVFGVAQARFSPPLLASSLALGGWLYALNFPKATGVLAKTGVLKPPSEQTTGQAAVPIAAHAAFGLATAAAYRTLG